MDAQGTFQAVFDPTTRSLRITPLNPQQFVPTLNTGFGEINGIVSRMADLTVTPPRLRVSVIT